jgi:hypothetical protein
MLNIKLIGTLDVDTQGFLAACQTAFGRDLSAPLASRKANLDSQASWLSLLGAMKRPDVPPESVLYNPGGLGRHLFFTFLVVATPNVFPALAEAIRPSLTWAPTQQGLAIGIMSGNLEEVASAVLICNSDLSDYTLRDFGNKLIAIMEGEGFSRLWANHTKKAQPDGTFKLLEKK